MNKVQDLDRKMLQELPQEKLLDVFFMHVRNIWRVDGLYFLGIERQFGTEAATRIDADCWRLMGKLEARELTKLLDIENRDVAALLQVLRNTSWSLYQEEKEIDALPTRGIYRVTKCRTQETRMRKGLGEFPCKNVRFSYLNSFVTEFNSKIRVTCRICPPDKHSRNVWCEWEFTLR